MRSHHFTLLSCLALALLFLTCPSLAQPRVARGPLKPAAKPPRARVAVALDNGPARFGPVEARAGQRVTLYLVLTRSHQGRFTLYYTDAPTVEMSPICSSYVPWPDGREGTWVTPTTGAYHKLSFRG
ncbi:hypothetical protein KKB55_11560 [Myxococcota bacterium]|nr:hypothetical protein [Myxococcota bacterium]MBU1898376.1 hypothetical protein [Myxococcota bacterium]